MPNLNDFRRRITVRARNIQENTATLVRKVALAADQTVVMETPVDTGRARSNWIVAMGGAASGIIDAYAPGEAGSTEAANTQAAIDQGAAIISGYTGEGQEIHITNNLPYIQRLNEGWSAQAPAGFVEMAVQTAAQAAHLGRVVDSNPGSG